MATKRGAGVSGLLVYIPADLHKKFKKRLVDEGQSQKSVIMTFIEAYCEDEHDSKSAGTGKAA